MHIGRGHVSRSMRPLLGACVAVLAAIPCLAGARPAPFERRFVLPAPTLAAGAPAEVVLIQREELPHRHVRCSLTVSIGGKQVFSHVEMADWDFGDPGVMRGWKCHGYDACRRVWLDAQRDGTVQTIDASPGHAWHFLLEPGISHDAATFAADDLAGNPDENLRVPADVSKRVVRYIVDVLAHGPVQVLVVGGTPQVGGMTLIYVPELSRFVKINGP